MKIIIFSICCVIFRFVVLAGGLAGGQAYGQELERNKEAQFYSTTHNLRKEEIRTMMQKQPFVIDVVSGGEKSSGMGFFIGEDGTAMTSHHVVEGSDSIFTAIEGVLYSVEIVGFDEVLDVAVLKVKNFQSHPLQFAKSDPQPQAKITISDKKNHIHGKVLQGLSNSFVCDVEISQGFSGSPVFCGDAICGVVTSFQKQTGNAIATKISKIAKNLEKMTAGENFKKKKFDFYVMDLQKYDSISLEDNARSSSQKNLGVLITHSIDEKLQAWDIITAINSQKVQNVNDLQLITSNIYASDETTFTILRGREVITITIP